MSIQGEEATIGYTTILIRDPMKMVLGSGHYLPEALALKCWKKESAFRIGR